MQIQPSLDLILVLLCVPAPAGHSCLILDHRYHCFYIHGKSVHAHADVSMQEMNLQLGSEQV